MTEETPGQAASRPLPPGLDLLWGRRERGRRGPRPGLSADAIVNAAVRLADAEGLEAVSMAKVAAELGFTTMSLYRYVASKEELLQLMWNASATGAEELVIEGADWRSRLRAWAVIQREMLDRHPWITQMPMAAPPVAPNSLHFVERGLQTLDGTGISDIDKLRIMGLLSSYTLSEARMAADAMRAMKAAMEEAVLAEPPAAAGLAEPPAAALTEPPAADAVAPDGPPDGGFPDSYEALLRELVDEKTYPHLYRLAWAPAPDAQPSEREQFLWGIDLILDGVQALIERAG